MGYRGEDMIGDDGYGTWSDERLDQEYRKLKKRNEDLLNAVDDFSNVVKPLLNAYKRIEGKHIEVLREAVVRLVLLSVGFKEDEI